MDKRKSVQKNGSEKIGHLCMQKNKDSRHRNYTLHESNSK